MMYELEGFKARAKARPRSTRSGAIYMPTEYQAWKRSIREYLAARYNPKPVLGLVSLEIAILSPGKPSADIDNLAGGLLDAIQPPRARGDVRAQRALEAVVSLEERMTAAPGCLIGDDRQVVSLRIDWVKSKRRAIVLRLEVREAA